MLVLLAGVGKGSAGQDAVVGQPMVNASPLTDCPKWNKS